MVKFQGKVALITGSGTGIGKAIAKKFVESGASVIILGRREQPLVETSDMLKEIIGKVNSNAFVKIFAGVDVASEKDVSDMFDSIKNENITVDYIINNAGVSGPVKCFPSAPLDDFKSTVGIHLTGTFWTSVQALKVMKEGGKIITISTFFTEERPLEQRPYRFRSPYTASQGAKNRLAEAMSWELVDKKIISIATNPGPVHSDRIYKTVYPKAASEFMRVGGFEDLNPETVDKANNQIVELLGEEESTIKEGIANAAKSLVSDDSDIENMTQTLTNLFNKIQRIAEKIQNNTSHMIADRQFLSQLQVAQTVLSLCDDDLGQVLNGKVIPGDRVFYPVKPHVGTIPTIIESENSQDTTKQLDLTGKTLVFTVDATNEADVQRVEFLAQYTKDNGGKTVCLISEDTPKEYQDAISNKFHSHVINLKDPQQVSRWLNTAKTNIGDILGVIHITGNLPNITKLTELSRSQWEGLIEKFITTPANVAQQSLEHFVPGGEKDPRLFKDARGSVIIIGPDLPTVNKESKGKGEPIGIQRAQVEVFRGALRPFTTTVNQELSDVLKSKIRMFLVLSGSVSGTAPDNHNIARSLNFLLSDKASTSSSEVIFCVDEKR
jgi:NAD(P)-dependent dehydrogenase (short-subunit alcohol dehydrogenase family)